MPAVPESPEHIWSVTGTYDFGRGLAASVSVVDVDSTHSGFTKRVKLPAYTLVNAGLVYEQGNWLISIAAKNLTDERYFRSNFPNLFGRRCCTPRATAQLCRARSIQVVKTSNGRHATAPDRHGH